MSESETTAAAFEAERPHLRAVAYRLLGSGRRGRRRGAGGVAAAGPDGRGGDREPARWLTTVVARIALNMLRSRGTRREQPLDPQVPDPIVDPLDGSDPSTRRCSPTRSGWRCWW